MRWRVSVGRCLSVMSIPSTCDPSPFLGRALVTAADATPFDQDPADPGRSRAGSDRAGMSPLRELQLLEAYLDNDDVQAVGTLLSSYQRRVYGVCYRMVRDRDVASDLTQEALVRILEHLGTFNRQARLSTWIIRIAMNTALSYLRRQKLRRHASIDEPLAGAAGGSLAGSLEDRGELSGARRVEQDEARTVLLEALTDLDPEARAIIVLRDLQDLDYQQVADVLDVPVGTVKSRLFRARVALRQATLARMGEADEDRPDGRREVD